MKKLLVLLLLIISTSTYASGGFTWISYLAHAWHLPEHTITLLFVAFLLILAGFVYRSKITKVPNIVIPDKGITFRNITEVFGTVIYNQCRSVIGEKQGAKYFPFIMTIFIVILISNLLGLIPGFLPPTDQLTTTLALGLLSFFYFNWMGIKEQGLWSYIKHFAGPMWYLAVLIFPLEILSTLIRPVSLALRLRGNIFGDHLVVSKFSELAPFLVPIPFLLLGLMVCFIQAYVFTMLSMVYISLAVAHQDHGEHAH